MKHRTLFLSLLGLTQAALFGLAAPTTAQAQAASRPATSRPAPPPTRTPAPARPATPAPQPDVPPAGSLHPLAEALRAQGVRRCLTRAHQAATYLTRGGVAYGGTLFVSTQAPDTSIATISIELRAQDALAYATLTLTPRAASETCAATYELFQHWNLACPALARQRYPQLLDTAKPLSQSITALGNHPTQRVFLIPAGTGCISVEKDTAFE